MSGISIKEEAFSGTISIHIDVKHYVNAHGYWGTVSPVRQYHILKRSEEAEGGILVLTTLFKIELER
jgi:hypothetical protein